MQHRWSKSLAAVAVATLMSTAAGAQEADDGATLTAAADVGFAPFAMEKPSGGYEGFAVDLANAVAERLDGYSNAKIIDTQFNSIFSGLYAGRYDFIVAPTNITQERAKEMLFTEGYMGTGLGFLTRKGEKLSGLDALDGKAVAVNSGSVADTWASENAETYGYEVQRYGKNADAVQAVLTNRAYANIADLPSVGYIATQQDRVAVSHTVDTGNEFGLAFSKENAEMRNDVEDVLEDMKLDGTLAELHKKWFGVMPEGGTAMTMVSVGHGQPGTPGYELTFD